LLTIIISVTDPFRIVRRTDIVAGEYYSMHNAVTKLAKKDYF